MFLLNFYQNDELTLGGIPLTERVSIGRNSDNRVVLSDTSVSRRHAVFVVLKEEDRVRVLLQDLGSKNGCEVNGRFFRGAAEPVVPGDQIRIGVYRAEIVQRAPELSGLREDREGTIIYQGPPLTGEPMPVERLKALYELASSAADLELEDLLSAVSKAISSCLRYDVLCFLVRSDGGPDVVRTWNASGPCEPAEVRVSKNLIGKCLRENLAILADKNPETVPGSEDSGVWSSLSCALCVPLVHGSWNLGAIYVSSDVSALMYDRDDLEFLILVGHQVSNTLLSRRALQNLRAEAEKLEAVLGSLQEGVLVADADFVVLSANEAAARILCSRSLEGRRLEDILSPFEHGFDRASSEGLTRFQVAVPPASGETNGGGPRVYSATVSENARGDREAWKYVICLHDETHIERNERLKSLFVNRLAHKLRTPLTVIAGVNSLIAQQSVDNLDPELRGLLEESLHHAQECSAVIERFVEYTSLNLAQEAAARERCRIGALVASAEDSNKDLALSKEFSIVVDLPEEDLHVRGKERNLTLVFHHIVQNAVKFGRHGGTLTIAAGQSGEAVRVRFLDDGPGIPTAELENLCKMLHQVDVGNTGQVPGAGLGLWIARAVLQAHRGEILITSPAVTKSAGEGAGTLVEIRLPAAVAEVEEPGVAFVSETVPLEA